MSNDVELLRSLSEMTPQYSKAWAFLNGLVVWRIGGYGRDECTVLNVEGKVLPIPPCDFLLALSRFCKAFLDSKTQELWLYRLKDAYNDCVCDAYDRYMDIPTMLQLVEADERLAGLGSLGVACIGVEEFATCKGLDEALSTCNSLLERIEEALNSRGIVQTSLIASKDPYLVQKYSEQEQALSEALVTIEAQKTRIEELEQEKVDRSEREGVIPTIYRAKGSRGVMSLCEILRRAEDRGVITRISNGTLQWGKPKMVTKSQCSYFVKRLNEKYPQGRNYWSAWCGFIVGVSAESLSQQAHNKKSKGGSVDGSEIIDAIFDGIE